MELCERIQRNVLGIRPLAVQWAIRQAELQFASVREGHERLKTDGHVLNNEEELKQRARRGIQGRPTDADDLLRQAEGFLKSARAAYEAQDYATAWADARRTTRPLRALMFGYWAQGMQELRKAVEESLYGPKIEYPEGAVHRFPDPPLLVNAASCPPAISFATLPQLHIWKDWIKGLAGYRFGPNRVPSGSFDDSKAIYSAGWTDVSHQYSGIVKEIKVPKREKTPVAPRKEETKKGARTKKGQIRYEEEYVAPNDHVLMMKVTAEDPKKLDELDPFVDEPVAAILSPGVRVAANNLVRISVLIRQPYPVPGGKSGVIIRDSIGGEPLQFRTPAPIAGYSRVVLYRKAPADGVLRVLLGLAGFGEVYFDDFRVQVIEEDIPYRPVDPGLVQGGPPRGASPRNPDPQPPAAALASPARRDR
jgi:hypothetical protein